MKLSIDPGASSGWALWRADGALCQCGAGDFDQVRRAVAGGGAITVALVELPQVYKKRNSKGDPNDLIAVAVQVGRYVEALDRLGVVCRLVHPHDWKGTIPKNVHHAQIWSALAPNEQEIVRRCGVGLASKPLGDMLDAVGLGQWARKNRGW